MPDALAAVIGFAAGILGGVLVVVVVGVAFMVALNMAEKR